MDLIKHEPLSLLRDFHDEIDRLFSRHIPISTAEFPALAWNGNGCWPEVDIEDNDKNYVITANVPGIDAKNIDISYNNGNLIIKGKTSSEREEKGKNYIRTERSRGTFYRSFALPDVDDKNIDAKYKDGLLTITIPKSEASTTRKIEIKT